LRAQLSSKKCFYPDTNCFDWVLSKIQLFQAELCNAPLTFSGTKGNKQTMVVGDPHLSASVFAPGVAHYLLGKTSEQKPTLSLTEARQALLGYRDQETPDERIRLTEGDFNRVVALTPYKPPSTPVNLEDRKQVEQQQSLALDISRQDLQALIDKQKQLDAIDQQYQASRQSHPVKRDANTLAQAKKLIAQINPEDKRLVPYLEEMALDPVVGEPLLKQAAQINQKAGPDLRKRIRFVVDPDQKNPLFSQPHHAGTEAYNLQDDAEHGSRLTLRESQVLGAEKGPFGKAALVKTLTHELGHAVTPGTPWNQLKANAPINPYTGKREYNLRQWKTNSAMEETLNNTNGRSITTSLYGSRYAKSSYEDWVRILHTRAYEQIGLENEIEQTFGQMGLPKP
jgi:hypothetical protein